MIDGYVRENFKNLVKKIDPVEVILNLIFNKRNFSPTHLDLTEAKDLNGFNDIDSMIAPRFKILSLPFLNKEDIIPWEKLLNVNRLNIKGMIPLEWIGNIDWVKLTYLSIDLSERENIEKDINALILWKELGKTNLCRTIKLPSSLKKKDYDRISTDLTKKGWIIISREKGLKIFKLMDTYLTTPKSDEEAMSKEKIEQFKKEANELIKGGADINVVLRRSRDSLLNYACRYNNLEILNFLVGHGANLKEKDRDGKTLLHQICTFHDFVRIKAVTFLIENGVGTEIKNRDGNTPLHYAIYNRKSDLAILLMEQGANVNATNNKGETPFHLLCCTDSYFLTVEKKNWLII